MEKLACKKFLPCTGCPSTYIPPTAKNAPGSGQGQDRTFSVGADSSTYPEFSPIPIVFNLCEESLPGGTSRRVIEEYSGFTGNHIRTIPHTRFRNPIFISAGKQYLIVVDRFASYDLLRVTDKYAGAGEGGFDDDGFPLESVDWPNLPDLFQYAMPVGYRATGFVVNERGLILVNLSDGSDRTTVHKVQIGTEGINKTFSLGAFGAVIGAPTTMFSRPGDDMYLGLTLVNKGGNSAAILFDWLTEKPQGLLGLPDGWTPQSVSESNSVIAVLLERDDEQRIMRVPFNEATAFLSGIRGANIPKPLDYPVSATFIPFDSGDITESLPEYFGFTMTVNRHLAAMDVYPEAQNPSELRGRNLPDGTTTQDRNANRTQENGKYISSYYGVPLNLSGNFLDSPEEIKSFCDSFGAVCESIQTNDLESPVFRVVEGKNHSYLSDGGFVYGCETSEGSSAGSTSGFSTNSFAMDVGYEPGKLKPLPDFKLGLIDAGTGLYIYRPVKPLKNNSGETYKMYSGHYASIGLPPESTVRRTECTTLAEQDAFALDGVPRPSRLSPADDATPAYGNDNDLDAPWEMFIRRAIAGANPVAQPSVGFWSMRYPDSQVLLPEHQATVHIAEVTSSERFYYAPNGPAGFPPVFSQSVRAGFFVPNYQQDETTRHTWLAEQIELLGLEPESDERNAQIAAYQDELNTTDDSYFVAPTSATNVRWPSLETSEPQILENGAEIELPPRFLTQVDPWEVLELPGRRGVTMDTNIRSWIGVELRLERNPPLGAPLIGATGFRNNAYYNNGLGTRLPGGDYNPPAPVEFECTKAAHSYEWGYDAADAVADWEYEIYADGVPIDTIATRLTNPLPLQMAPQEAQTVLQTTMNASTSPSEIQNVRRGLVWHSPEVISEITIVARLVNNAYDVIRTGRKTRHYVGIRPRFECDLDPGFLEGANCETVCCGNLASCFPGQFSQKLFPSDPTIPRTTQILWQGEATYKVVEDPYRDRYNVGMGRIIDAYFDFRLNNVVSGYRIDISRNNG